LGSNSFSLPSELPNGGQPSAPGGTRRPIRLGLFRAGSSSASRPSPCSRTRAGAATSSGIPPRGWWGPLGSGSVRAAPRRERARLIAGLILGGVGLAFALVNLRNVKVDWIVGSGHSPLILVIAVSVLIGVGIDRIAVSRARKRSKTPDT
jgi:uncharacterized integral membrane protein